MYTSQLSVPPRCWMVQAWKLFLSDPTARFKYESKCAVNRISTISVLDAQLTLKCQTVLDTFPSFVPLQSQNTVMAMKTALSYIHTITPDALDTMGDAYYALILPLLLVWRVTDASSLVEAYSVLLALARPVVLDDAFTSTVVHRLNSIDASFVAALTALFPPEADLVVQCQKAVFGRWAGRLFSRLPFIVTSRPSTYTPIDVRDLTGKAKASYEKKLPKESARHALDDHGGSTPSVHHFLLDLLSAMGTLLSSLLKLGACMQFGQVVADFMLDHARRVGRKVVLVVRAVNWTHVEA
ncbi:hypothetical protein DYB32_010476, partial [Aphanomyces invadans]